MCLEESFCSFTRDALKFWQPKIYSAPHHQCSSGYSPLSPAHTVQFGHRFGRLRQILKIL